MVVANLLLLLFKTENLLIIHNENNKNDKKIRLMLWPVGKEDNVNLQKKIIDKMSVHIIIKDFCKEYNEYYIYAINEIFLKRKISQDNITCVCVHTHTLYQVLSKNIPRTYSI